MEGGELRVLNMKYKVSRRTLNLVPVLGGAVAESFLPQL